MYILYVDSPPLSTGFLPTDNEGLTILSYFTEGTWASMDFGICGGFWNQFLTDTKGQMYT